MMQRDELALMRGTWNTEVEAALREAIAALDDEWHDEAILACERALKTNPACAEAIFLLGLVAFDLDEPVQAINLLEKAHELSPQVQEFAEALAAVQARLGKVGEALFYAKLATSLAPHPTIRDLLPERFGTFFRNIEAGESHFYRSRAERKFKVGGFQETLEDCRRQLELTPGDELTLRLMAHACLQVGRIEQSIAAFHAVLHGGTLEAEDLSGLARALAARGRPEEAEACHQAAMELAPDDPTLHSRYLADLVRQPGASAARLAAAHAEWSRGHATTIIARPLVPNPKEDPDRPLRIAYLSGAFYQNDLMELFAPVLRAHSRDRVQVYCYSDGTRTDTVTEGLMRASHRWTDITGVEDETVWQILRGDEIDIAVDLSGHYDMGRPLVFARRPAPVTVSWLGYPYPSASPGRDYFLTDEAAWPSEEGVPSGGGAVWKLPRAPFAYLSPVHLPPTDGPPAARAGHLTFGASCDLSVLSSSVVRRWAGVLWTLRDARILICNRYDQDQSCIDRCLEAFSHFGLRDRVDVVNRAENFQTEFDFYHYVDVAFDTGSPDSLVENCRALWMGVPVFSLAGEHHAQRLGASLLTAAGRPDWVARGPDELLEIAARTLSDLGRLAEHRSRLREEMSGSTLGDTAGLTLALEEAYRAMWRTRCVSRSGA